MSFVVIKPIEDYNSGEYVALVFFIIFVIVLFTLFGIGCSKYYDSFTSVIPVEEDVGNYNSLYVSPESYIYTQPPGDQKAQMYGRSGQGTSGGFFPIQGRAAGTFMKNSGLNNLMIPTTKKGTIGGQSNYTEQDFSTSWNGFNNFGAPFSLKEGKNSYSDSYLIDGSNQRVSNPGQKTNLACSNWWPFVNKDKHQFCTQGSDAIVPCKSRTLNKCNGKNKFIENQNSSQWRKVINP